MEIFFLLNMIKRYEKRTQLEDKMLILIHNLIKQIILMDERFRVFQDTYNGALYFFHIQILFLTQKINLFKTS